MAASANTPEGKSNNTKLWLVIMTMALIIVCGAAVGSTYIFMNNGGDHAEAAHAKPKPPPPEPVFVAIDPFTANLQDPRGRVLYVRMSLRVEDDAQAKRVASHMPQVRNRILMTLTDESAEQLTTADGKQALAERLKVAVAEPFAGDDEPVGIDDVLFTDFIVQ